LMNNLSHTASKKCVSYTKGWYKSLSKKLGVNESGRKRIRKKNQWRILQYG